MLRGTSFLFFIVLLTLSWSGTAKGQGILSKSEISLSAVEDLQRFTSGNNIGQGATNGGGFQVGYRYSWGRMLGVEVDYARTRDTQSYDGGGLGRIQTNVHSVSGDLLVRSPIGLFGIKPYVLGGAGGIFFRPTNTGFDVVKGENNQTEPALLYGFGIDYRFFPHVSLRAEYRGFFTKAPDFGLAFLNTGSWTQIAQPAIGIAVRF